MVWRVLATTDGFYNQVYRQEGEVFDLLLYQDKTYPPLVKYLPKKVNGKVIEDEYDEEIVNGPDGKPIHLHYAEDQGMKSIKKGPKKGDTMRFGWMRRVPEVTPVGLYKVGTDFWHNHQLPPPVIVVPTDPRERGSEDHRRNHARILEFLPPEEAAA